MCVRARETYSLDQRSHSLPHFLSLSLSLPLPLCKPPSLPPSTALTHGASSHTLSFTRRSRRFPSSISLALSLPPAFRNSSLFLSFLLTPRGARGSAVQPEQQRQQQRWMRSTEPRRLFLYLHLSGARRSRRTRARHAGTSSSLAEFLLFFVFGRGGGGAARRRILMF